MQSARDMRPLWRDLILKVWGADPLQCPCCKAPMKLAGAVKRPEQVEFFLRLHGLWEGIIQLPRPQPPPFDIEQRRGIGGVLDGGEAGARRVSPPGGAGESNHGAHRAALAGNQGMDCRRSALAMPPARSSSGSWFHDSPPKRGECIPDDEPDLDWFNRPRKPHEPDPDWFDQSQTWQAPEIHLDDGRILILEYT